jgi:hypothetical protein
MLARRLGIELPDRMPEVRDRLADWCVHEFRAGRRGYLLLCHTGSMFPVVALLRGVTDGTGLKQRMVEALRDTLTGPVLGPLFSKDIEPRLAEVQFAPVPDRSVTGTMNDLIFAAKVGLNEGMSVPELSPWLAVTPLSILGMNSPDRVIGRFSSWRANQRGQ